VRSEQRGHPFCCVCARVISVGASRSQHPPRCRANTFFARSMPSFTICLGLLFHSLAGTFIMRIFAVALAVLPAVTMASSEALLLLGLEQRLQTDGAESVNAYLNTRSSDMAQLNRLTADCAPQAIDLAVKLSRSRNAKATDLHKESLRIAVGACTEYVLSQLSLSEVPEICASASSWTVSQTARELRRRIRDIETDKTLRSSQHGQACSAAYRFELENTRVGVRAARPPTQPK
jgi:hypothetical protein